MTPERLSRIRAIYEAAIDVIPAARQELIERECASDSDLRQEVQRLITVRENLPQWLADPAVGPTAHTPTIPLALKSPQPSSRAATAMAAQPPLLVPMER